MHIGSVHQCNWIRERVENPNFLLVDKEKKVHIFERLCFADTFENFLANKFNTTKRFGLVNNPQRSFGLNLILFYHLHEFNSHIIFQFPLSTPLFVDSRYIISITEIINSRIQLSITSFDISLMILSFSLASFTLSL